MDSAISLLQNVYFGNTLLQFSLFFLSILGGIILGRIIYYISKNQIRSVANRSASKIDDYLVDIVEEPLVLLLFTIGLWIGTQFLTLTEFGAKVFENIIFILIASAITWFLLRIIDMVVSHFLEPLISKSESKLDDQILPIVRKSLKTIIAAMAAIVVLSNLGYDILSVLAGLGIGGLALALAAQDAVKNVIGGLTIFWDRPFQIDDWIQIGSDSGTVAEVGIRSTRLKTIGGTTVIIPNSKVADNVLENFSTRSRRRMTVTLGLTYETTATRMKDAIKIAEDTVKSIDGTDHDDIMIRFINFGSFSLDLEVVYWITDMDNWKMVIHQVNIGLKENLDAAGIDMAFPTETHYVIQENGVKS